MLSNEKFLSKAPEAKVQEEKDKLAGYEQMMAQVKERLAQMKQNNNRPVSLAGGVDGYFYGRVCHWVVQHAQITERKCAKKQKTCLKKRLETSIIQYIYDFLQEEGSWKNGITKYFYTKSEDCE